MAPIAGMEFLGMHDQARRAARRVPAYLITDVRNPLFLVDDEIVDRVEIFRLGLSRQVRRRVPIDPAVVHVDVEVGAPPPAE